MKKILIYTDGSCINNPGPGGIGIIIKYNNKIIKKISLGYYYTTNNRMELIATILALKILKYKYIIILFTDSKYLYLGMNYWIKKWKLNNWKNSKKKIIKNYDLWYKLSLLKDKHLINFTWIKSHNDNYENEICDKLAKLGALYPSCTDL